MFVAGVLVCSWLLGVAWCGVVVCRWRGFCVVGVVSCGVSLVWPLVVVLLVCCCLFASVSPAALLLGALLLPSPVLASLPLPLLLLPALFLSSSGMAPLSHHKVGRSGGQLSNSRNPPFASSIGSSRGGCALPGSHLSSIVKSSSRPVVSLRLYI